MIKKIRTIYPKLLGSMLVLVFLFTLTTPAKVADLDIKIPITFQIKNTSDNSQVFEEYNLDSQALFQNIFKANVSSKDLERMQNDPLIAYAQIDQPMTTAMISSPDPFFTISSIDENKQWYLAKIRMPDAWEFSRGSSSVVVAIVDTGIHSTHVELNDGRVGEGYNVIENKVIAAGAASDDNGHGTAVAGVIGAIPNNQKGIAGINWDIKLMPIKALAGNGTGDTSAVATGIVWAADHGANIINLSLGGPGFGSDQTLSNAISYAYNKGVLLIAAAGNDLVDHGQNLDSKPTYPVCGDNGQNMIVGVAATDINDQKADFSNFGALCIDIAAPGKRILTAGFLPSDPADNILIYGSGTSLATPIVSGVAALMKAQNPNLSNGEIRNLLLKTADNIDAINQTNCLSGSCNGFLGKGRINAYTALAPQIIGDNTLVKENFTNNIYLVTNNSKRLVSSTVFTMRGFSQSAVIPDTTNRLAFLTTGLPLPPPEGTLVKSPNEAQVYVIENEMKRPLTYLVFISRAYSFANIKILPQDEVTGYLTGEWAAPPDGTMVLIKGDPTVYVMDQKVVRPVTFFVFTQRKLSFTKVISVTNDEFSHIARPTDLYWLSPKDGTLVKSSNDAAIYVIELGAKRLLSYDAFVGRNYKFSNVVTLPPIELNIIAPGQPLLIP